MTKAAARLALLPEMPGLAWHSPVGIKPGTPLDNAVAESFFKTLKRELAEKKSHGTRGEAKRDIFKRIELYCNRVRMHSTLGYMSPVEYERQYA